MVSQTSDRSGGLDVPQGELCSCRVVADLSEVLSQALEERLTGYVVLEPQDTLLLDGDVRGVVTFEDGVPVLAYDVAGDESGRRALARLADPGPYRVERYEAPHDAMRSLHGPSEADPFRIPPGAPAEELAADPDLAESIRKRAPDDSEHGTGDDPLDSFLADEDRVEAIQAEARAEAKRRAAEWGLDDALDDDQ